ncbi:zinc finger protein CONSTANS-LIKE 6 [Eucalyptus grandis]|uniref:zinc finger protein CONSTANS-LIKE 6 n=1 Tax=Eucalyptus grandis TaxID=71139 RepID=UPI00192E818F|nr:zinc finger protein CONSTANS-LIKE 6 [Eucalyptus grandis]XP_039161931.1 zinc finger protein CONSTANS-LIKE 6 [Eucalyptus grandis]
MITERKAAKAFGAKTARACDSCLRRRARWYCTADDAFLCQGCDSSVHSANQLARRHERVRLGTASSLSSRIGCGGGAKLPSSAPPQFVDNSAAPAWHGGFTRKARTPRISKKILLRSQARNNHCEDDKVSKLNLTRDDNFIDHNLVPELGNDLGGSPNENYNEEDEEQFLYRVPVFNPLASEMIGDEMADLLRVGDDVLRDGSFDLPSDMDLAEFAADVENLLSNDNEGGTEEDFACDVKDLGVLLECKEEGHHEEGVIGVCFDRRDQGVVKVEGLVGGGALDCHMEIGFDATGAGDDVDWDFDFYNDDHVQSLGIEEKEDEEKKMRMVISGDAEEQATMKKKRKMLLRLNYEGVMAAWASQGSPWTTGDRPDFELDEGWPNSNMGTASHSLKYHLPFAEAMGLRAHVGAEDGGREARVSRYREKRRTRMFSKKIRYQVRKLNAEKRPRMKGRFVKRMSFI